MVSGGDRRALTDLAVVRLMRHAGLSQSAAGRIGPEDYMACQFAADLRVEAIRGTLTAVWFHPANELIGTCRSPVAAAKARAMGLHKGVSDFIFLWGGGCAALEAKSAKGSMSGDQIDFQRWCTLAGVPFHIFRSVDEGFAILRELGVYHAGPSPA